MPLDPKYFEEINLNTLISLTGDDFFEAIDKSSQAVYNYVYSNLFTPEKKFSNGYITTYMGLTKNSSLVIFSGSRLRGTWKSGLVTLINMKEKEEGLAEKIKSVAINAIRN